MALIPILVAAAGLISTISKHINENKENDKNK